MKKVYCKNCIFFWIGNTANWCKLNTDKGFDCQLNENKNLDCKYYKRKWYKFLI